MGRLRRGGGGGGGGGGGSLIFSAYVGLDPASNVSPIKISEQQAFPNIYVIES